MRRSVIAAKYNEESALRICEPGSNLAEHRLLDVTVGGELILRREALATATGLQN